ncbi:hypothetical protein BCR43DRAFT_526428 [Syncephalastrum racemosum]|uniref:Uncharacterized protein n=1 Tax=Syncephalastrum racemosum TaxID=13706 RepID=A0A1X2H6I9_SYNRA|nr:hypothetical protein BCR43DRAFT_526428 [Syncephalastrum racemosum]
MDIIIPRRNDEENANDETSTQSHSPVNESQPIPYNVALQILLQCDDDAFQIAQTGTSLNARALQSVRDESHVDHVYQALKHRILKQDAPAVRLGRYLATDPRYGALLLEELNKEDRRDQLAALLVVDPSSSDVLLLLTDRLGNNPDPRVLERTAYATLLRGIKTNTKEACHNLRKVLPALQKWHGSETAVVHAAWNEVDLYFKGCEEGASSRAWEILEPSLQTARLLKHKAASMKRLQALIAKDTDDPVLLMTAWVSAALHGAWTEANISDLEHSTVEYYPILMKALPFPEPFAGYGVQLLGQLTLVYPSAIVPSDPVLRYLFSSVSNKAFIDLAVSFPGPAVNALVERIQQHHIDTLALLEAWLQQIPTWEKQQTLSRLLIDALIPLTSNNDKACEALIKTMTIADLPGLLRRLLSFATTVKDARPTQICKALIAKTLLHPRWESDGLLLYIDLIRDYTYTQLWLDTPSIPQSPADIQTQLSEKTPLTLTDFAIEYLAVLQLWVVKVSPSVLERGLTQLARKFYGSPQDPFLLQAWKSLSLTLRTDHIGIVIQSCLTYMTTQPKLSPELADADQEMLASLIYIRLAPMLILQVFPPQTYTDIRLPHDVSPPSFMSKLKYTEDAVPLHTALYAELLDRALADYEFPDLQAMARTLLNKIFCQ